MLATPPYGGKPGVLYLEQPSKTPKYWYRCVRRKLKAKISGITSVTINMATTYYWLDVISLAGMLFMSGTAPPPSRKFWEIGGFVARLNTVPLLVEISQPLKYGTKLTAVPLYMPLGFRIPGTRTPLLG